MKTKHTIIHTNNIEWLKSREDNSIDLIITSPPYNLGNKGGDVNVDTYKDDYEAEHYEAMQVEFLNECYRVLKPLGAMFYNHKNRYTTKGLIMPITQIIKSNFKVKQEIIWDRTTTADREASKFAPLDEKVFWLYKDKTFRLKSGAQNYTNIWEIPRPSVNENKGHKATFPYALIYRIMNSLDLPRTALVLDPYNGTGTTLQVANNLGYKSIGLELDTKWIEVADKKASTKNSFIELIPSIKGGYKKKSVDDQQIGLDI